MNEVVKKDKTMCIVVDWVKLYTMLDTQFRN